MSFETVAQTVIFNILSGDAGVSSLVTGVYDSVPETQKFPYIVVGEDDVNEWDTSSTFGADIVCTISIWSRDRGKKETKEIQGKIYEALHTQQDSAIFSGYDVVSIVWQNSTSFLESDGLTRHGISTFRLLIDKEG